MSFILDALKKSEHKRRMQAGGESVAIYEASEKKATARRQALQLLMIFLLLGILLLLGVLVWQRPWSATDRSEQIVDRPVSAPEAQLQREIEPPAQPAVDEPRKIVTAEPIPSPEVAQPAPAPVEVHPAVPVPAAPPAQGENQVYSISDLPTDVRRRLPALQMALHAYNAVDAAASLVQINGRLVREGAQIAEDLSVDEITGEGAILRSGNYRFLLPRRGQ